MNFDELKAAYIAALRDPANKQTTRAYVRLNEDGDLCFCAVGLLAKVKGIPMDFSQASSRVVGFIYADDASLSEVIGIEPDSFTHLIMANEHWPPYSSGWYNTNLTHHPIKHTFPEIADMIESGRLEFKPLSHETI